MNKIKKVLLQLKLVVDNEYLDKYVDIVSNDNSENLNIYHKHHIIPIYYYKNKYNILNRKDLLQTSLKLKFNNKVIKLSLKNHILAHYYLEKCSTSAYRGKNIFAIYKLVGKQFSLRQLYSTLDNLQILEDFIDLLDGNYLFTDSHRQHLKDSVRNRKSSNNLNISKSGYVGGVTGLKMMYDNKGKRRYVNPNLISQLLMIGWTYPTNKKKHMKLNNTMQPHSYHRIKSQEEVHNNLSKSHLGQVPWNKGKSPSLETREKLSKYWKGSKWMNNGKIQSQVPKDEIQNYLLKGYKFGCLKQK